MTLLVSAFLLGLCARALAFASMRELLQDRRPAGAAPSAPSAQGTAWQR
ncbi:hypothetical protein [Ramlibacter tataouinensis]|nr:hypothetical protein [Ramlibacter tataouinensis]